MGGYMLVNKVSKNFDSASDEFRSAFYVTSPSFIFGILIGLGDDWLVMLHKLGFIFDCCDLG